jgi:hypothetical protein
VSWDLCFSEPIELPNGNTLATLQDARHFIAAFPKSEHNTKEWLEAMHFLTEAADHNGALTFARIGVLRTLNRPFHRETSSNDQLELIDWTMREVQRLNPDSVDPSLGHREASQTLPVIMETIAEIFSSPSVPKKRRGPSSKQQERQPAPLGQQRDNRSLIASATLQSAITEAVKTSEPDCKGFVGVIVQQTKPKSRFDTNWAVRGVRFGRADRATVDKTVATIVERMQREFRLSDDQDD